MEKLGPGVTACLGKQSTLLLGTQATTAGEIKKRGPSPEELLSVFISA